MDAFSPNTPRHADVDYAEADIGPIRYIERTREYYLALGYGNPYRWAHYREVPFTAPQKPLAHARLGLFTTAAPFREAYGDQGPGAAYNASAKFYEVYTAALDPEPDLRISHLGYDRKHTTAADTNTYFPRERLQEAVTSGRIGALASPFYGIPTNRSQNITLEKDCPDLLRLAREDDVDVALLVPS